MDEILLANYMVFRDLTREQPYDLWIGDEAWEVDHFLHENPEDKRAPFVFLSDFVGWLPLPEGGEREAFLCADLNAQMLEQVARFPSVRDRALFVGDPEDVVPGSFGPGLPAIREWVEAHFEFCGQMSARRRRRPSATGTGRCASPRSAARRSAPGCSRGWSRATRRPPSACPACGCSRSPARAWTASACARPPGSRCAATCPTSTACWRGATSRSCRAGSPPAWSSSRRARRSSRSRSSATSSSASTSPTGSPATATRARSRSRTPRPRASAEAIAGALGAPVDYRAVAPGGAARAAARIAELL